jgi:hypothetical protein
VDGTSERAGDIRLPSRRCGRSGQYEVSGSFVILPEDKDLVSVVDRLREGGFSVDRVLVEDLRPVPAVCAIGRPQGG